jgi:hypothetical protein
VHVHGAIIGGMSGRKPEEDASGPHPDGELASLDAALANEHGQFHSVTGPRVSLRPLT